jgi:hypothetical protein
MTATRTPTTATRTACSYEAKHERAKKNRSKLLKYNDPRNLARFRPLTHTRFTYHRTWETRLGAEIRVTVANLEFFCAYLNHQQTTRFQHSIPLPTHRIL